MTADRRWLLLAIAFVAAAVLVASIIPRYLADPEPGAEWLARTAAIRFLDRYVEPDGRVVRRYQGGDTVSEAQAYAMLLAVAVGDAARFDRTWRWAKQHLLRKSHLLAWRWKDGRIVDRNSAADADVDAAYALVLAARRFHRPDYLTEARRIARSILKQETVAVAGRTPVLVAGPWARKHPYVVNPSYFAPRAFVELGRATGDPRWGALVRSSHRLIRRLTVAAAALPPDWARLDESGILLPIPSPADDGATARHGFDAARLFIRLATDCGTTSHRLARAAGRLLPRDPTRMAAIYDLHGKRQVPYVHPVTYVAASAVTLLDGDSERAQYLLRQAEELEHRRPTYYGAAWVALGRVMLTTSLLTDCSAASRRRAQRLGLP